MKLKGVKLIIGGTEYTGWQLTAPFLYHSAFIWYYLSRRVSELDLEMEQPFDEIVVDAGSRFKPHIYNNRLFVTAPSVFDQFEAAEKTGSIDFYLEAFEKGLKKVKKGWGVPYEEIKKLVEEGKKTGFPNREIYQSLLLGDCDLKIELIRYFTRNEIAIDAAFSKLSTGEAICQGHLFRALPDQDYLDSFKEIYEEGGRIIVVGKQNDTRIGHFEINEALRGKYEFHYASPDGTDIPGAYWLGWYKYYFNYSTDGLFMKYPLKRPELTRNGYLRGPEWVRDLYVETAKQVETIARPM